MRRNRAQLKYLGASWVSEGEFRFGDIVNGNFSHESTLQRVLELVRSDSRSSASENGLGSKSSRAKSSRVGSMPCVAGVSVSPLASSHAQDPRSRIAVRTVCELAGDPTHLVTKA
jgi:hypothetical protein